MVAKVEWHPGELVPRVGFIGAFYNQRGTAALSVMLGSSATTPRWRGCGAGAVDGQPRSCLTRDMFRGDDTRSGAEATSRQN